MKKIIIMLTMLLLAAALTAKEKPVEFRNGSRGNISDSSQCTLFARRLMCVGIGSRLMIAWEMGFFKNLNGTGGQQQHQQP